jgi:hypothetical protein
LLGTLEADPERARKVLAQHVGEIRPQARGDRRYYLATGGLDLSVALGSSPKATEQSLRRLVAGARNSELQRAVPPRARGCWATSDSSRQPRGDERPLSNEPENREQALRAVAP